MFETLFIQPGVRRKHAGKPNAMLIEKFAKRMQETGYGAGVILAYLYHWEMFTRWLSEQGLCLQDASEQLVDKFIGEVAGTHPRASGKNNRPGGTYHTAMSFFMNELRKENIVPCRIDGKKEEAKHPVVEMYVDYLQKHRRLSEMGIYTHRRIAKMFFEHTGITSLDNVHERMTPEDIEVFLSVQRERVDRKSISSFTSVLRGLFRYLYIEKLMPSDFSVFVSSPKMYRLASLPSALPWEDVEKTLNAVDRGTQRGRRDYAILLLIATYGSRASEITSLTLDDIKWRGMTITIHHKKTGRTIEYPLASEVGDAIIEYLKDGRPASAYREVFLTTPAPHTPLRRGSSLYYVAQKYILKAGVSARHFGPHTFRHSYASHLLKNGHDLKTIGDMLGHRDPESTYIYTKIDVEQLREVALSMGVTKP